MHSDGLGQLATASERIQLVIMKLTIGTTDELLAIWTEVKSENWSTVTFEGRCQPMMTERRHCILLPVRMSPISLLRGWSCPNFCACLLLLTFKIIQILDHELTLLQVTYFFHFWHAEVAVLPTYQNNIVYVHHFTCTRMATKFLKRVHKICHFNYK